MSGPVIQADGLTKRYGSFVAVDGVSLRIEAGEVFGMLGPNGAGKTTTILMILGLTEPTSGDIRVLGFDPLREPLEVKRRVGYLPDTPGFYDTLTARQNLRYTGRLAGMPADALERRIETVLSRVRLDDVADARVGTFSRGMRQRLGLADVLLKEPGVVILDEPTNGLDPQATREFLDLILTLKSEGMAVLLSSHLLAQVQAVCDRVGLFHHGRMALEGTVGGIAERILGTVYHIDIEAGGDADIVAPMLADVPKVVRVAERGEGRYQLEAEADVRHEVIQRLIDQKVDLRELRVAQSTLDDVYARYFREVNHAA